NSPQFDRPPTAQDDTSSVLENSAGSVIGVLGNDSDPDGDTLSITAVTQPAHGQAAISGGVVTYTPAANFVGSDSFTYTIGDGLGGGATATVSVNVVPPPKLQPGDILVANTSRDEILRFEHATGSESVLFSGGNLSSPAGITLDGTGRFLFVAN